LRGVVLTNERSFQVVEYFSLEAGALERSIAIDLAYSSRSLNGNKRRLEYTTEERRIN